jgi:hypothetical protein
MKKLPAFKHVAFLFLVCFVFAACSSIGTIDIKKRHYRKGFYFNSGKIFSADEKSGVVKQERSVLISEERNDTFSQERASSQLVEPAIISRDSSSKIKAGEKVIQAETTKTKGAIVKRKITSEISEAKKSGVPGWLSDVATIFLFALVCIVVPPYWFYFLGIVYIFAKNKKKATFFFVGGIVDTVGLVLTIVLLLAVSPLLLPVYLITLALGLFALGFALIRFFTL